MRIAALYDIHGNLPALEAVLAEVRREGVDEVMFGGDILPGPMPRECLDLLLSLEIPTRFIHGNCDRIAVDLAAGRESSELPARFTTPFAWCVEQLTSAQIEAMRTWPLTVTTGGALFCHATTRNDSEVFLRTTDKEKLRPIFSALGSSVTVCGHTHMQFDRMIGDCRVVNAGSVGSPYAPAGAYWLLLGSEIELRRTEYDYAEAAARILATEYPGREESAREVILPRSEEEMTALFSPRELG